MRCVSVTLVVVAIAPACAHSGSATQVLDSTVRAVGGRDAIAAAHTLTVHGEGTYFVLGQGKSPDQDLLPYRVTELERTIDYDHTRWHQRRTLTPQWAAQDPSPSLDITGLDGDVAFDLDADGNASRGPAPVARDRRAELVHSPIGILRAALAPAATVSNLRRVGGHDVIDIDAPGGPRFTLTVDATTRLPIKVASATDDPNLGDVIVETELADYRPAGGLALPTRITSKLAHQTVATVQLSSTAVNARVGELAAPAQVQAPRAADPAPVVTTEEIAPGVWFVGGGTHNSVVIELADHLLLVEAPYDDARALAVIAAARALRPAKPLTHVVCTHHHFDHSGGVRAAVSEGLTVIARDVMKPFLQDIVARPHTIAPDALARAPRPLALETFAEHRTIDDPAHPVQLFAAGSRHASTMLVAYLPRERLLIEADLFTPVPPGAPPLPNPDAGVLLELVETHHLDVDRVVPLHRQIVPFADLLATAHHRAP